MRATPLMLAIALGLGLPAADSLAATEVSSAKRADELQTWIVIFDEAPAALFRGFTPADGRRPKLAATSPAATGAGKYDARSAAARDYVAYLDDLRGLRLADASRAVGRELAPIYTYRHATNGVALALSAAEAERLKSVPGIKLVVPDFHRSTQTNYSTKWINADDIWNGSVTGTPKKGEGIVVGVIDTGINRTHVAFAGTGITNPRGHFYGYCTTNASACNSKLIGLYDFTGGNNSGLADPVDNDGHGTHTASTAAGNAFSVYTGVAPAANIIAYKACPDDSCEGTALIKSIDQAVADGVDVINYSIGGGQDDPWRYIGVSGYNDTEAFLAARVAGVVPSVAAGNEGPDAGTVTNPGNAPWVFGVAAASADRSGVNNADRLASFSGRGPVVPFGVLKPDLTGPGVQISAAGIGGTSAVATLSGTSMATPHVAGAAALLKSVSPAWTADQIMSALSLTARNSVKITNAAFATPHQQGAGMIDVAKAARAGLYLQVPAGSFQAASANVFSGNAEDLNLPSLAHGNCFGSCTLTRNFRQMPGAPAANYSIQTSIAAGATITPSVASFNSSAAGTSVTFSVNVSNASLVGKWVYGTVTLVNNAGDGRPDLKLPIAVFSSPYSDEAGAIDEIVINANFERGFQDVDMGSLVALPNARFVTTDLATPKVVTTNIALDATEDDAYDNVAGNYVDTIVIPGTGGGPVVPYRIVASTTAANPDIDLFVGRDANANGLPEETEELCRSTTATGNETCEITLNSSAIDTTVWVMAQNYSGPGTNVRIETVKVPVQAGSGVGLVATGPGNVPSTDDFTVRLAYDDATMLNGSSRFGFLMVQPTPGNTVVEIPVRIKRTGAGFAPYALAPGVGRSVTLPAGAAHDTLVFDVPAHANSVTFTTTGASGSVSLYAARVATPNGPTIAPAPARNAAGVVSATAAGANQTITVSGAGLQPGRWYVTPVNTGASPATVEVKATINTVGSALAFKPGSYYDFNRGGHGVFIYPSGSEYALLWYTYFQDRTPTWYYVQAAQPGSNGVWNGTVYRSAWNGSANSLKVVGNMVITPSSADSFTMAYNIDGFTGAEPMVAFLTGCPTVSGTPLNVSAHWYEPALSGYGYSVQVHPNYEFHAVFNYDGLGVPRFLAAERGGAFNAAGTSLTLNQLTGFAPLEAYNGTPARTAVGTLTRTYGASTINTMGTTATFANGLPGSWNRSATVTSLSSVPQGCAN